MYLRNAEPSLHELLSDPVMHLLMARDGLSAENVWQVVEETRRRLRASTSTDAPGGRITVAHPRRLGENLP